MTPQDRQKILTILGGKMKMAPLVHTVASSKYGLIMIEWLWTNRIWGEKLEEFWFDQGHSPFKIKKYILKKCKIKFKVSDLL